MIHRIFQKTDFKTQSRRKNKIWRQILKFFLLCLIVLILIGVCIFGYFSKDLPSLTKIEKQQENIQPSRIYDRTGQVLLFEIKGERERIIVPLSEISPWLQKATIATEDANFYHHFGLNFKAILRAVLNNFLIKLGLKETKVIQGGSTITQQVIKNALLTPERTIARKIKEAILSVELEFRYPKEQILELYLNQVSYGMNAYGAEAASRLYFGKSAKDLSLSESAILASLPKAPSRLSPYGSHLDELFARQEYILERMVNLGLISQKEKEEAQKQVPKFISKFPGIKQAPHFVMYVKDYLEETYGEDYLKKGGLKIYTTLDSELQQASEEIIKNIGKRNAEFNTYNEALAALDPKTGQILAMVGSKDYFASPYPENCKPGKNCLFDPNVNVAICDRQPGSAFKPFVYSRAFQKGYTPNTVLFDVETEFNPACPADASKEKSDYGMDCYHPQDYDGKFRGPVTIKQALAQSLNIPSVKLLYLTGIEDSIELAHRLGITTLNEPSSYYGLPLVLGGGEVKLLDMVSAYGAFATGGILNPKTAILKIEDNKGKIIEEFKLNPQVVLEENVTFLINDILSDNEARTPMFGENSPLNLVSRPAAVKTGTSQDYKDAWTIGYTPSLVCGVWAGNNDNTPIQKKVAGYIAAPIWNEFMKKAYEIKTQKIELKSKNENDFLLPEEIEEFIKPETEITGKPVLDGEFIQKTTLEIDKISGKIAGPLTPQDLIEKRDFQEIHSILYYVGKDDPRGEMPQDQSLDSQYENWEQGIQRWLNLPENELTKNLKLEISPKEYDDIHTEENLPRINLLAPPPESIFNQGSQIEIKFLVSSLLGIEKIDYFLNETLLNSKNFPDHEKEKKVENNLFLPGNIKNGNYILKIKVADIAENVTEKEIPISIQQ